METADKFGQIVSSRFAAVLFGNAELTDFELIAPESLSAETQAALVARGFESIGAIGVVDGKFRSALTVPLDDSTADTLAAAFVQYMVPKLVPLVADKLCMKELPDAREN